MATSPHADMYSVDDDGIETDRWIMEELLGDDDLDEGEYRHVVGRTDLGGSGSGNFGHAGRPGEVGGSAAKGARETSAPVATEVRIDRGRIAIGQPPTLNTLVEDMRKEPLPTTIAEAEDRLRGEANEHGIVITADGRVLRLGDDHPAQISMKNSLHGEAKDALLDSVFTHNHPRGHGLSVDDGVIASFYNVREMRAVTMLGTHVIRRKGLMWPLNFDIQLRKANESVRREFSRRIESKAMTIAEAESTHHEAVYRRLAKATGEFEYVFEAKP